MDLNRLSLPFGVLAVVSALVLFWLAFQRQMCAAAGGIDAAGGCAPNINYLLPAVLVGFAGVVVLAFWYRRTRHHSEPADVP